MEVREEIIGADGLCLQWINEGEQERYRIVNKSHNGETARGAPRFESMAELYELLAMASEAGWLGTVESCDSYPEWIKRKFKMRKRKS